MRRTPIRPRLLSMAVFFLAALAPCWLVARPAHCDEPTRGAKPSRFQLPPGFIAEEVAAPPLVRYPLFAALDDQGRLFVAEGTGTNLPGEKLANEKLGRILLLEDIDGDGKFDTSKVFADRLVFPQGVLWHDGAVFTASHPSFWRLEDTQGDGKADRREELVTGFRFNGNGCDIHGPFLGPDGRLYWTDGRHGYQIATRDGQSLEGLAARIWRCRTDGSELERLCGGGFDNPVELAFLPDGELVGTMDQGAGDCLLHYVEGGVYPMDHPCIREFPRSGPLLGAVKQYSVTLPAALCGTMRYRSEAFGAEYRDVLITTHFMTHKLVVSKLIRDGATLRADDADFLVSQDPHLRLTDALEDADGSLLVVDMGAWYTYGFLGNPTARPEMLGAIYRIRREDAPKIDDPRGSKLDLAQRSAGELAALLDDPRPAVRDQAMHRLAKLDRAAVAELASVVHTADRSEQARRNAVWALCRIDADEARAATRPALFDRDLSVRMAAVHAMGLHRDGEAVEALSKMVQCGRASPPLRRKAAEALGRIGSADAVGPLLEGLHVGGDLFLEHSLVYALIQIDDPTATLAALRHADPRVRRGGLIALDQMPSGRLSEDEVVPLLDASDADLQQAALEVLSRRPTWAEATKTVLAAWLGSPRLSEGQEKALNDILIAKSSERDVQDVVADALRDSQTPRATVRLLVEVAGRSPDPLPPSWCEGLRHVLATGDAALRHEVLAAIKSRSWRQFDEQLIELARQPKLAADLRLAAWECLAGRGRPLDDEAFNFLVSHLSDTVEPLLRLAAARTLAGSPLSKEQAMRLAAELRTVDTMVLRLLLPQFGTSGDAAVGLALVEALQESKAAEALTIAELDNVLAEFPAAAQQAASKLRDRLAARLEGQGAYLARLTAELDALRGDADAGKEIFLSPQHNCYACHRAVGRGGDVGPELTQIGGIRTRAELLESIVFPSLIIAPPYRSHQVTTKDGRVETGLIVRESADALHLRTTNLNEVRVNRADVDDLREASVSLMPDGLEKTLSRQQLRDLLEFLCSSR